MPATLSTRHFDLKMLILLQNNSSGTTILRPKFSILNQIFFIFYSLFFKINLNAVPRNGGYQRKYKNNMADGYTKLR